MKRFFAVILSAFLLSAMAVVPVYAEGQIAVNITNTASVVYVGDTVTVAFEVTNNGSVPLALITFDVTFDSSLLKNEYIQVSDKDSSRIVSTPGDIAWEHIIRYCDSDGGYPHYEVDIIPDNGLCGYDPVKQCASEGCLKAGESVVISLPFTVLQAAEGKNVSVEVGNVVGYDGNDISLTSTVAGSGSVYTAFASAPEKPVTTLGAKINYQNPALRLGARYERAKLGAMAVENVEDLGIVFYPTRFLGDSELTLDTAGAAHVSAVGIENFDPDKDFVDYESFEFYVTIINIPYNGMDDEISFRAFVKDAETVVYADTTLSRSYDYVYNTVFPSVGSGSGENVILPPTGWFD